ncbi:MAG: glycine cleavage system protein H [Anaeromyxobacteraceae bacterium]
MTTSISILSFLGIVLAGLTGRFILFVAGALVLAIPAIAYAYARLALGRATATKRATAGDLQYREDAFHAPTHTWLAPQGDGLAVGLDDFGQQLLPSVTAVDLPRVGARVRRGEPVAVLHAGRLSVRVPAPVDGTVKAVNRGVERDPGRVKSERGGEWLFNVAPGEPSYLRFPKGADTKAWLTAEKARLARFVEGELGLAAADGGELPKATEVPAQLGDEGFSRLVGAFLEA